jgi:hypothetical protein
MWRYSINYDFGLPEKGRGRADAMNDRTPFLVEDPDQITKSPKQRTQLWSGRVYQSSVLFWLPTVRPN